MWYSPWALDSDTFLHDVRWCLSLTTPLSFHFADIWRSLGPNSAPSSCSTSAHNIDPLHVFIGISSTRGDDDRLEEEMELLTTALTFIAQNMTRLRAFAQMERSKCEASIFFLLWIIIVWLDCCYCIMLINVVAVVHSGWELTQFVQVASLVSTYNGVANILWMLHCFSRKSDSCEFLKWMILVAQNSARTTSLVMT